MEQSRVQKGTLDGQQAHWEKTFSQKPEMFGSQPSYPAVKAAELFKSECKQSLLELGAGQGRDTFFFAQHGLHVCALDYSQVAVETLVREAERKGSRSNVSALQHDVRNALPFPDASFDGCYSHMLYCMALTTPELECLSREVYRVLKPGGLSVYTVRTTKDAHFGTGTHRGENMYEVGGFIVHFFDRHMVERLTKSYERIEIEEFEEGNLPRKLFLVTLKKGATK